MSMFREHWIGGLVAYSTFFIISFITTIAVPILYDTMPQDWNLTIPPVRAPIQIIGCFAVAVLFGLWPDVDIKSKSQKIFYSVLFVLNVVLIFFFTEVPGISTFRTLCDAPDYEQTSRVDARQNHHDFAPERVPVRSDLCWISRMEVGQ